MSAIRLFDTHCHIDFAEFDHDRTETLQRAAQQGITDIIVPAVSQQRWSQTITICQQYSACHLALGLHPMFIEQHQPQHLNELDELLDASPAIAVGEIGLDFYHKDLDQEKQRLFFAKQLIIAQQHDLPVIIHNRKAHDLCLSMLEDTDLKGGIIHAFNGSIQQAEKYSNMGFLLGFGGMLTFTRSNKLRQLAKAIPLQHIVLETDAPDMTVFQHKGGRNSPEYIPYIVQALAQIKEISMEEVIRTSSNNAKRLFKL